MFWTLCLSAFAVHMLCATLMMRYQARAVIGWRIGLIKGLYGQFAIAVFGVLFAGGFLLLMDGIGLRQGTGFYLLIGFAFIGGWSIGQSQLTEWMSQRAKDLYLSQARARRITSGTILYVVMLYVAVGTAGFWIWYRLVQNEGQDRLSDAAPLSATSSPPPAISQPAAVAAPPRNASGAVPMAGTPAAPAPAAGGEPAVMQTVSAWAQAWSRRDVDAYIAFYAPDFRPAEGLTRAQWETQRRERIGAAPNIAVTLEGLQASLAGADHAMVKFRQTYKSDRVSESVAKTLRLRLDKGAWKIVEEKTGA